MKKQIQIAEPCHEKWGEMSPQEKGRHCAKCDKVVVDFTNNSRNEITKHLENSTDRTCGRFRTDQVDHFPGKEEIQKSLMLPGAKAAALTALATSTLGAIDGYAQGQAVLKGDVSYVQQKQTVTNEQEVIIKGTVHQNWEGEPVKRAQIRLYSGGNLINTIMTNANGEYMFTAAPGALANNQFTIKVFTRGADPKLLQNVTANKKEITLNTVIEDYPMVMGLMAFNSQVQVTEHDPILPDTTEKQQEIPGDTTVQICNIEIMGDVAYMPEEELVGEIAIEPVHVALDTTSVETEVQDGNNDVTTEIPDNPENPNEEINATIFPNPSADVVTVQLTDPRDYTYQVFNLEGKTIYSGNFSGTQLQLNFDTEERGTYIINIYSSETLIHSGRIIISR